MKTPTLSEYIDFKENLSHLEARVQLLDIITFNEFWKSQPQLGHFIPCTKDNKPLEEPKELDAYLKRGYEDYVKGNPMAPSDDKDLYKFRMTMEYQEALSRVRWVGWSMEHGNKAGVYLRYKTKIAVFSYYGDGKMDFHEGGGRFKTMASYGKIIDHNVELEPTKEYAKELNQ